MIDFEKIGKYKIDGKLGQGSFGVVYKGRDAYLKRDVAIKVCSVEDEGLRKRFFREAEISGKLVHKNIVTVYEFGFENDIPYLVQEMLSGEDLSRIVKRREPLAPALKLEYLLQVANGLGYAHSEAVIHRDIKPGNIRVLEDSRIKIMDFGIAKLASAETQLTQKGVTMGTASYLPPEQVRGAELDHRADIFSFGVLAYELMTFERPFKGNTLSALIYQILYKVPRVMSDVWPECPGTLSDIIAKCLEKKPERRYGSFAELIPELTTVREEVLAGKWPALRQVATTPPAAKQPTNEPSDVVSQTAIAQTARGVLEGKVGDYTISTAVSPAIPRPSGESPRATQPIEATQATETTQRIETIQAAEPTRAAETTQPIDTTQAGTPPADDLALKTRILATPLPDLSPDLDPSPDGSSVAAPPPADLPFEEDSADLTIKARELIDLVAEGKLEPAAAKEQLDATFSKKDLTAVVALSEDTIAVPAETVPEPPPVSDVASLSPGTPTPLTSDAAPRVPDTDAAKSDTYRTVFRPPLAWLKWAGAAAAALIVAGIGWQVFKGGDESTIEPVEQPPPPISVVQPVITEPEMGAVTINASPWAQLTEITDAQGYVQQLPPLAQTPLYLELLPGQYKIHLQNPEGTEVQTCDVEVALETVTICAPTFTVPRATDYFKETGWWD